MAAGGSTRVVLIAFGGNLLIALCKLAAALFTGASAMLAEAIHSFVDSGNQLLLLWGLKRAKRPADKRHPFGYGMEVYFWAFIVAILLFSLGAGVSIYEGIKKIENPHPVESPYVNYVVLGLAILFEGYAFRTAIREMNRQRRQGESAFHYVRRSKDAATFVVLFEDAAALLGIFIAIGGLVATQATNDPVYDGWASVAIGCLLALAAVLLASETKSLLIGESADPKLVSEIEAMVAQDDRILRLNELLTMHLGPHDVLVTLSVDFKDDRTAGDVEASITGLERRIKDAFPEVRRVFIEAQSWRAHQAERARAAEVAERLEP